MSQILFNSDFEKFASSFYKNNRRAILGALAGSLIGGAGSLALHKEDPNDTEDVKFKKRLRTALTGAGLGAGVGFGGGYLYDQFANSNSAPEKKPEEKSVLSGITDYMGSVADNKHGQLIGGGVALSGVGQAVGEKGDNAVAAASEQQRIKHQAQQDAAVAEKQIEQNKATQSHQKRVDNLASKMVDPADPTIKTPFTQGQIEKLQADMNRIARKAGIAPKAVYSPAELAQLRAAAGTSKPQLLTIDTYSNPTNSKIMASIARAQKLNSAAQQRLANEIEVIRAKQAPELSRGQKFGIRARAGAVRGGAGLAIPFILPYVENKLIDQATNNTWATE